MEYGAYFMDVFVASFCEFLEVKQSTTKPCHHRTSRQVETSNKTFIVRFRNHLAKHQDT